MAFLATVALEYSSSSVVHHNFLQQEHIDLLELSLTPTCQASFHLNSLNL